MGPNDAVIITSSDEKTSGEDSDGWGMVLGRGVCQQVKPPRDLDNAALKVFPKV